MKKVNVVFDFVHLPISGKVAKGRNIITDMMNNPNFPTPDISLDLVKELTDLLENRSLAAQNGGKAETTLMHQTETVWDDAMRKMARYVERIANDDPAIILSAGFNLSKQPLPYQRPELSAEQGEKSGTILLRRQAVPGAKSYIWQYCINTLPENESGWTFAAATSKASTEIDNLIPVSKYWFRVAAVTPQGVTAYNDPIMHIIA